MAIKKIETGFVGPYNRINKIETDLTKYLMNIYGLDVVRGGDFVMAEEAGTWWVPLKLELVPRFTQHYLSLSEHTFSASLQNALALFEASQLQKSFSDLKLPLEHEQDGHQSEQIE